MLAVYVFMFLVFVLILARELISKYKNGSSIFAPFSSSYWCEELKNKNKIAIFDFWFLVSLLEHDLRSFFVEVVFLRWGHFLSFWSQKYPDFCDRGTFAIVIRISLSTIIHVVGWDQPHRPLVFSSTKYQHFVPVPSNVIICQQLGCW